MGNAKSAANVRSQIQCRTAAEALADAMLTIQAKTIKETLFTKTFIPKPGKGVCEVVKDSTNHIMASLPSIELFR
jgi:hypothetical protein